MRHDSTLFSFRADYSPILKNLSYSLSTRMPESGKAAAGTDGDKGAKVHIMCSPIRNKYELTSGSFLI